MTSNRAVVLLFSLTIFNFVAGDIYWHNPRGSNNRLNEARFNRVNDKRLFDSQNNNRGGYNVGSVYYYHGSQLEMEWTNQHSCGGPNNNCNIVIQYMCDPHVRDGATTRAIPVGRKFDTDSRFGRHESLNHYLRCSTRRRNTRLFTADQKLKKDTASFTRQNPGGTRYAYECAEERDYFPYWHSSPWRDIAVLTNNVSRCDYYQSESQNVKERWECRYTAAELDKIVARGVIVPNDEAACRTARPLGYRGTWTRIPKHDLPAPDCREVQFTRDNHLGNTVGTETPRYRFTVPEVDSHNCVLRIRYNISTNDYDSWRIDLHSNADKSKQPSKVDLALMYKMSTKEASERGYTFKNNPQVQIFQDADFQLELAINTAQYGRVFQDRSHVVGFRPRPPNLTSGKIHNVNVRGKRGNIVQVYPAVEYDFVPNSLEMSVGDYIHFQWTGSDNNPQGAAGNGRARTDRTNVVRLTSQKYAEVNKIAHGLDKQFGYYGNNYPEHLDSSNFLGLGPKELENLAFLSNVQYGGLMSQLDDASPYFNLLPQKVNESGTFYYMSTRNNDFTNRDQKAVVHVYPYPVASTTMGFRGGHIAVSDRVEMRVDQGVLCGLHDFRFEEWPRDEGDAKAEKLGRKITVGKDYASDFIVVYPLEKYCINPNKHIIMGISIDSDSSDYSVYRTNPQTFASWTKLDSSMKNGKISFQVDQGGAYVVRNNYGRPIGLIVGVVLGIVIVIVLLGSLVYFRRHPNKFNEIVISVRNAERGAHSKV